jgi:shikimate kinase
MKAKLLVIAAAAILSGCAVFRSDSSSWVEGVPETDAAPLSAQIADLTAARVARGEKVRLADTHDNAASQAVDASLKAALAERGIAVTGDADDGVAAHTLRYIITPYGDELLLRVSLDSQEAATVLVRDPSGGLAARAPLSVREVRR